MGKRASGGRGGRSGQTDTGRQVGKQQASKVSARGQMQRARLQRALAKAEALPADSEDSEARTSALMAVHEDGAKTYKEFTSVAHGGEEWVQAERLKHLSAIYKLNPAGNTAKGLREDYVLTLLDEGEAAQARKVLEELGEETKTKAVYAWSMALVELVAWKGEEEGASEEVCIAAVEVALATNQYIGIFLSNLDCYTREIDPSNAPAVKARVGGTVEECLAYTAVAAGCWMDFDKDGSVTKVVGERLESIDVVWPPTSEGKTERFLRQFSEATEVAEKEADDDEADEGQADAEEADDEQGASKKSKSDK